MNDIDEIRRQMAQIRHDLHRDVSSVVTGVSDVVSEVTEVMDWRSYLRAHPLLLVGAAMAAGYLVVPRKKHRVEVSANSLVGTTEAELPVRRKRFRPVSMAFDMLWPIATQALQAYAMVWIENRLKQHLQIGPEDDGLAHRPGGQEYERPASGRLR